MLQDVEKEDRPDVAEPVEHADDRAHVSQVALRGFDSGLFQERERHGVDLKGVVTEAEVPQGVADDRAPRAEIDDQAVPVDDVACQSHDVADHALGVVVEQVVERVLRVAGRVARAIRVAPAGSSARPSALRVASSQPRP